MHLEQGMVTLARNLDSHVENIQSGSENSRSSSLVVHSVVSTLGNDSLQRLKLVNFDGRWRCGCSPSFSRMIKRHSTLGLFSESSLCGLSVVMRNTNDEVGEVGRLGHYAFQVRERGAARLGQ